ncbi:DUF4442 domain-containing protein [Neptunicella sp. SCSIO 80796]|uniref:DUF4442 domain-containing protein n=1 Tax=Neptunicella plasticusilytica TaxID=3117012 RepID=UPI003A4D5CAB
MPASNPLRKFVDKANQYPDWLSSKLMTWMFRSKVKLAGTCKIDILSTDGKSVTFRQRNISRAQNHIKGIHAAAMTLLAESATGFITGINLPGDKLPLVKKMDINFVRRASGDMTAKATLTDEQIALMQQQDKGEITVQVEVKDANGDTPIECEIIWAWIPRRR